MSTIFSKRYEEARQEFYVHVKPEAQALAERPERVTAEEWREFRGNSYERRLIVQNLSDEALLELYEYCESQASVRPLGEFELARHYDHAVAAELAPLLAKRLREKL